METEKHNNLDVFNTIVNALRNLDIDTQKRTLQTVMTFLDIQMLSPSTFPFNSFAETKKFDNSESSKNGVTFSENRLISPKDFLRDKAPHTDIERVACLAYYLTHYRNIQYFKSLELSSLNTEAAQPKFSNISVAVDNATQAGFLVQGGKGNKQISAIGEMYVQALPDRESAKNSIANMKIRGKKKKTNKGS
jgi:hypothetical protein